MVPHQSLFLIRPRRKPIRAQQLAAETLCTYTETGKKGISGEAFVETRTSLDILHRWCTTPAGRENKRVCVNIKNLMPQINPSSNCNGRWSKNITKFGKQAEQKICCDFGKHSERRQQRRCYCKKQHALLLRTARPTFKQFTRLYQTGR